MDVRNLVLIRFPIIAQRSKGTHYFHRVIRLVLISMSVRLAILWAGSGVVVQSGLSLVLF